MPRVPSCLAGAPAWWHGPREPGIVMALVPGTPVPAPSPLHARILLLRAESERNQGAPTIIIALNNS